MSLRATRVGIAVECRVCGYDKKPIGRSAPLGLSYCDDDCDGYRQEPRPGSLWPRESEADFGYPVGADGTTDAQLPKAPAMTEPIPPATDALSDEQIAQRLRDGDQRRCPFDSADCKVQPDQPCPVCGDVDDLDVSVEDHKPSMCVASNYRLLRTEAADALDRLTRELSQARATIAQQAAELAEHHAHAPAALALHTEAIDAQGSRVQIPPGSPSNI
jgi:hypothetical protein